MRIIVVNSLRAFESDPALAAAAREFPVVTPGQKGASPHPRLVGRVLVVWPDNRALRLAEQLSEQCPLCVVSSPSMDVEAWSAIRNATVLV